MYETNFDFELGVGVFLWSYDQKTAEEWKGNPLDPLNLPISEELRAELSRLGDWWQTSVNAYPPDPSPWRQGECDRFNEVARTALTRLRWELGPTWDVIRSFGEEQEDPDLDRYLRDPDRFQRYPTAPDTTSTARSA